MYNSQKIEYKCPSMDEWKIISDMYTYTYNGIVFNYKMNSACTMWMNFFKYGK